MESHRSAFVSLLGLGKSGRMGPKGKCPRGLDPRPKIPDSIATDDEDCEPPAWYAWDEWDQKVNVQEGTIHLKYKARKGQFDDHDKIYKKSRKKKKSSRTESKTTSESI